MENKIDTVGKFMFFLIILISVMAFFSYIFQICWNMGLVQAVNVREITFATSSYLVGLISLVGYFFRWINIPGGKQSPAKAD